jgi:FkbM family methyltransferase
VARGDQTGERQEDVDHGSNTSGTTGAGVAEAERPGWCAELIAHPRPSRAVPGMRPEDKSCLSRTETGECKDGSAVQFFSQHHQDVYLYVGHFSKLRRAGVYWDVAANDAVEISNTYFFDRCLGWRGVCVEANPRYFGRLTALRSCVVVPTCVSNRAERVTFRLSGAVGGVESTVKSRRKASDVDVTLDCVTGAVVARKTGMTVVDLMSLDVEGHELRVLEGMDWAATTVRVIVSEAGPRTAAGRFLLAMGYRVHDAARAPPDPAARDEYTMDFAYDTIYLHADVVWGQPE